jgi:predicted N-formylglutamate amidohydrolase
LIIVCDHASNRIPAALGNLGVDRHRLIEHIAWDIGAAGVARRLQARFGADAILANYSRLVIDLNRRPGDFTVIPPISDGLLIPGNLGLSPEDRDLRGRSLHAPYHQAIEALIGRRENGGEFPVFVGIHSFTPRVHGTDRPWHAGILWDRDPRLSLPLLHALRGHRELIVGDNEPYSGRHTADYTIDTHAEIRGMAHAGIEIRQDLIAGDDGQARWAALIGDALEPLLDDHRLFEPLSPVNPMP